LLFGKVERASIKRNLIGMMLGMMGEITFVGVIAADLA
jgi:hypothetical protein